MTRKTALVAGASGVVGRGFVDLLENRDDWDLVALARKPPDPSRTGRFLSVDLTDPRQCQERLASLTEVTHIFFAALLAQPTEHEMSLVNTAMLRNLLDAIEPSAPNLEHVCLIEGAKAYGCHFGPYKTPAKETDPRHLPPNFYFDQEDLLIERQKGKRWSWSALRPSLVCGPALGHPMNMSTAIAVYATMCKELGLPLQFPGTRAAFATLFEATDALHLARAGVWAATEPRCANQIFNITNGDFFRWENLWPKIGEHFGLAPAAPLPLRLAELMADKAPLWQKIVEKHGLVPHPFEKVASWGFTEFVFRIEYDVISDTTKARRFGFHDVVDTEEMFMRLFRQFAEQGLIPR